MYEEDNDHVSSDVNYWKKYKSDSHFDYILRSEEAQSKTHIFQMIPIELYSEDDLILIKINVYDHVEENEEGKSEGGQNRHGVDGVHVDFFASGSEIQYIAPGEIVRGVVSNKVNTYKIYEFYVNQIDLYPSTEGGTDLYI